MSEKIVPKVGDWCRWRDGRSCQPVKRIEVVEVLRGQRGAIWGVKVRIGGSDGPVKQLGIDGWRLRWETAQSAGHGA